MKNITVKNNRNMRRLQVSAIFICFLMNMLDGMDVMIISYTAPGIAEQLKISPQSLGVLFSSGLLGMACGALFLAPGADAIGRKKMILLSAVIMGVSIYLTSFANAPMPLVALRFISGLGIGSMLASTAALVAEYSPARTKNFWVSFVMSGYPVGAFLSGLVAARIIPMEGWQAMFQIAGFITLGSIPLIYYFLPESLEFYKPVKQSAIPVKYLLEKKYKLPTLQLWTAMFLAFATLYFLTSWIPKLATNAGLSVELAIYAGTIFNIGSFFGIITQGFFSSRVGLKKTIGSFLIITGIAMAVFRFFVGTDMLLFIFGLSGFGISGGFVGLYTVAARMYPAGFRATGIGWSIGIGRIGAIIGPAAGGILIGMGVSMVTNFLVFAIPAICAGLVTMIISSKEVK